MFACVRFVQTFAEGTMGKFAVVIPAFVACSTIGSLNGSILGGSRYGKVKAGLYNGIHDTKNSDLITDLGHRPHVDGITKLINIKR